MNSCKYAPKTCWHSGLAASTFTSYVGGSNPFFILCARCLHILPMLLEFPLGTLVCSASPKTCVLGCVCVIVPCDGLVPHPGCFLVPRVP